MKNPGEKRERLGRISLRELTTKKQKIMVVSEKQQTMADKKVVMTTKVSLTETMLAIGVGKEVEYTVFAFSIESARAMATYLRRRGKGTFSVSKTSPTTFSIKRLL